MDTGNINRLDLLPAAAAAPSAPAASSAGAKTVPANAATAIVPSKDGAAAKPASKTELKNSVDAINRFLKDTNEVHFTIDDGLAVVKVIDTETKKVIRQFPSEQSLEIGKNLSSKGMLIDSTA